MQNGIKIGFVTSSYPDHVRHARGIFIHRLAKSLVDEGAEVSVVAAGSDDAKKHEIMDGVEVRRLRYWWHGGQSLTRELAGIAPALDEAPWLAVQLPPLLARLFHGARSLARSCDVVHAHWLYPAGVAAVAARVGNDHPLVVTSHGGDLNLARRNASLRAVSRAVLRRADAGVAVSPRDARTLSQWSPRGAKVEFLPVGVPTPDRVPKLTSACGLAEARSFADATGLRVLYVGSLVERKSVRTLLDAACRLQEDGWDVACAIVGDGPRAADLKTRAEELELTNLWFCGSRPPEEVAAWMRTADVVVLPSVSEPWGSVVPEAMAVETPVVVSETAGSAMLVSPGENGFTFPEGNSRRLARHLQEILTLSESDREAMGRAAHRSVLNQEVTLEAVARRHLALYSQVRR